MREITFHLTDASAATGAEGAVVFTPREQTGADIGTVLGSQFRPNFSGTLRRISGIVNFDSADMIGASASVLAEGAYDCLENGVVIVKAGTRVLATCSLLSLVKLDAGGNITTNDTIFPVSLPGREVSELFGEGEPLSCMLERIGAETIAINKACVVLTVEEI